MLVPRVVWGAAVDLGVKTNSISFSGSLVAGQTVRVYVEVTNEGSEDVDGYVAFYQGTVPIGDTRVISVRAGGVPEEVYVDFVVPRGDFNIRTEIKGTDPGDENPDNDVAITKLFSPIIDDDGDGAENEDDNCPDDANSSQADTDADGAGDACDEDDDDDALSDEVEEELGTDPRDADTDGDGVADKSDAYPTDSARTVAEPVVVSVPVATRDAAAIAAADTSAAAGAVATAVDTVRADFQTDLDVTGSDAEGDEASEPVERTRSAALSLSPKAIFSYERVAWNRLAFKAVTPTSDGYQFQWEFGDGATSSRSEVTHAYASSGEYQVTFKVIDPSGALSVDKTTVRVRFWTLENRVVDVLLACLALLAFVGTATVVWLSRRPRRPDPAEDRPDVGSVAEEDRKFDRQPRRRLAVRNLDDRA
jgi:hypothetical protein